MPNFMGANAAPNMFDLRNPFDFGLEPHFNIGTPGFDGSPSWELPPRGRSQGIEFARRPFMEGVEQQRPRSALDGYTLVDPPEEDDERGALEMRALLAKPPLSKAAIASRRGSDIVAGIAAGAYAGTGLPAWGRANASIQRDRETDAAMAASEEKSRLAWAAMQVREDSADARARATMLSHPMVRTPDGRTIPLTDAIRMEEMEGRRTLREGQESRLSRQADDLSKHRSWERDFRTSESARLQAEADSDDEATAGYRKDSLGQRATQFATSTKLREEGLALTRDALDHRVSQPTKPTISPQQLQVIQRDAYKYLSENSYSGIVTPMALSKEVARRTEELQKSLETANPGWSWPDPAGTVTPGHDDEPDLFDDPDDLVDPAKF